MANRDQATEIIVDLTVSSGDTLDTQTAEAVTVTLPVIATSAITLEEGEDSGGADKTAVGDDFIIVGDGLASSVASGVVTYTAGGTAWIGYVGKKRYLTVTVANPATDTTIGVIKGHLLKSPGV
jgi:hypothetical protein